MSLNRFKFKDICISISDGDHLAPPKSDKGVPFITISNITSQNQIDFSDTTCVPFEYYENLDEKRKARKNDILYSVVGTFGKPVLIKRDLKFAFQRHIAILRPNIDVVDPTFLYYVMSSRGFYKIADTLAIGAAQRTITLTSLRNLDISLPPLETQKRIASILSRYDDLIENYQRQIQLLEEAAQRLYKEWFVDLHFPGYENTKIVDGVPEGWEKKTVGCLLDKIGRTKQIPTSSLIASGSIPVIDQSRNFIAGYTNDGEAKVICREPIIVFGDHTRILKFIQFPFAKGADGTQLILSNNLFNMPQALFYQSLLNIDLSNYSYARHFKYLKAEEILVPNHEIASLSNNKLSLFYDLIQKYRDQIRHLTEARDRLLPKLMSGEITV